MRYLDMVLDFYPFPIVGPVLNCSIFQSKQVGHRKAVRPYPNSRQLGEPRKVMPYPMALSLKRQELKAS